jgi:hypothetical protein
MFAIRERLYAHPVEQLDMSLSWHKFYYESTLTLTGILSHVYKNTFCQQIWNLKLQF